MPDETVTRNRKIDHLRINLEQDVQFFDVRTGLDKYRFVHRALPELDLSAIDTSIHLFGKHLQAPLLVSSMTGGADEAERINRNLAAGAQATGIAKFASSSIALFR